MLFDFKDIKDVYSYMFTTFLVKNDGTLWSCGYNEYGQLGLGQTDMDKYTTFTQVPNMNNIKKILINDCWVYILKNDNSLWSCGYNAYGQLGIGSSNKAISTFTKAADDVKYVSNVGLGHTFILKNDGTVWACGINNKGQLGLGDTTNRNTFTQVNIDNVKKIITGHGNLFTFILKNDGTLWACGENVSGQLGLGDTTNRSTFTQVNIDNVKEIEVIIADHTVILKNDGTVWVCGENMMGHLGLGDTNNRNTFTQVIIESGIKKFVSDAYSSFIIDSNNELHVVGYNEFGNLGIHPIQLRKINITEVNKLIFPKEQRINGKVVINCNFESIGYRIFNDNIEILFSGDRAFVRGADDSGMFGSYGSINKNYFFETNKLEDLLTNEPTVGQTHIAYTNDNKELYGMGDNEFGQLGLGHNNEVTEYVKLDENVDHVLAIKNLTIIKKDGKYYVAGEHHDNVFKEYRL